MKMNFDPALINRVNLDQAEKKIGNKEKLDDEKLMEVCKDFESVFLYMMMKEMKKTVPNGGLVEKSSGTLMFEDMYMEELTKEISNNGDGIGLAKTIYEQFKASNGIIKG